MKRPQSLDQRYGVENDSGYSRPKAEIQFESLVALNFLMSVPTGVDAAVSITLSLLNAEEIQLLTEASDLELVRLNFQLGIKIRNKVGLWSKDSDQLLQLIAAAEPTYFGVGEWSPGEYCIDADSASSILLKLVKKRLTTIGT